MTTTIVLSDLHLGGPSTTSEPTRDGALHDAALVSFLDWLARRARDSGGPLRLVVLGDLVDLLHARTGAIAGARGQADRTAPVSAVAALESIAAAHPDAFAALAAAADAGLSIEIVPGNHDSELLDTCLQQRFRNLVCEHAQTSEAGLRLTFHSWFFLIPGVVYAEHGSQYHPINAVPNPLAPCGRWSRAAPLGALLDLHLAGVQERLPGQGRRRSAKLLAAAPAHARFVAAALGRLGGQALLSHRAEADVVLTDVLRRRAREAGLRSETLAAVNSLSCGSTAHVLVSLLSAASGAPSRVGILQQRAAVAIHRLLLAEQEAVPVYVFGHTHRPASATLDVDGARVRCLNSGAWSAPGPYTFVEIVRDADGVRAELRRWDADLRTLAGAAPTDALREPDRVEEGSR